MNTRHDVTQLLNAIAQGDRAASDRLLPIIYGELRALAGAMFRHERAGHTLQPTAVVHDAFLRLADGATPAKSKAHFMATAAKIMRQLLIDHARARRTAKRGGASDRADTIALDQTPTPEHLAEADVLDLDEALHALATQYPRAAQVVEMRYFGGLTDTEIAEFLDVGHATVERDWALARGWLRRRLKPVEGA